MVPRAEEKVKVEAIITGLSLSAVVTSHSTDAFPWRAVLFIHGTGSVRGQEGGCKLLLMQFISVWHCLHSLLTWVFWEGEESNPACRHGGYRRCYRSQNPKASWASVRLYLPLRLLPGSISSQPPPWGWSCSSPPTRPSALLNGYSWTQSWWWRTLVISPPSPLCLDESLWSGAFGRNGGNGCRELCQKEVPEGWEAHPHP